MPDTPVAADRCLCLYGKGEDLLDCFELARQVGVDVFTETRLAAAPAGPHPGAALEARLLGIEWYDSLEAMFGAIPNGLLCPAGPDLVLPEDVPEGYVVLSAEAARSLLTLLAKAVSRETCRPDLARARRLLATVLDRMGSSLSRVAAAAPTPAPRGLPRLAALSTKNVWTIPIAGAAGNASMRACVNKNGNFLEAVVFDFDGTLAELVIDFKLMQQRVVQTAAGCLPNVPPANGAPVLEYAATLARSMSPRTWRPFSGR